MIRSDGVVLLLLGAALAGCTAGDDRETLRLAVTTSTRDSGLLEVLLPPFEKEHGVRIDVIAVGSGKALKLGEAGDVDAVLVHAPDAEAAFMAAGHGVRREELMYNTFQIVGPADDPAQVRGAAPAEALRRIAEEGQRFVSRGDDSGTHRRELALWRAAGMEPSWDAYIESGQGMGATLVMADQMGAYTLSDRGTFLRFQEKIDLVPLVSEGRGLENRYSILVVNPAKHRAVRKQLAHALADYLVSPRAQRIIGHYRIGGQQLFHPLRSRPGE